MSQVQIGCESLPWLMANSDDFSTTERYRCQTFLFDCQRLCDLPRGRLVGSVDLVMTSNSFRSTLDRFFHSILEIRDILRKRRVNLDNTSMDSTCEAHVDNKVVASVMDPVISGFITKDSLVFRVQDLLDNTHHQTSARAQCDRFQGIENLIACSRNVAIQQCLLVQNLSSLGSQSRGEPVSSRLSDQRKMLS